MREFDLNLSTRPFPVYRALNLALMAGFVVLVLVGAWQVYGYQRYVALVAEMRPQENSARVNSEALQGQLKELVSRLNRPEAKAKLAEIDFLNRLILRKSFSWTRLFEELERTIPDTVHLISLKPDFDKGGTVLLHIDLQGKSVGEVSKFIEALEMSPFFERVNVSVESKKDPSGSGPPRPVTPVIPVTVLPGGDVEIALQMAYLPEGESQ